MKVESITDGNGNDVSGNPNHLANLNPLRYRSYFYDTETGFYWLNTRYYNPVVGRFLNADSYASTGQGVIGHNMFAYCGNNPVNMTDENGDWPQWLKAAVAVVAVVAVVAAVSVSTLGVGTTVAVAAIGAASSVAGKYVEDITLSPELRAWKCYNLQARGKTMCLRH